MFDFAFLLEIRLLLKSRDSPFWNANLNFILSVLLICQFTSMIELSPIIATPDAITSNPSREIVMSMGQRTPINLSRLYRAGQKGKCQLDKARDKGEPSGQRGSGGSARLGLANEAVGT